VPSKEFLKTKPLRVSKGVLGARNRTEKASSLFQLLPTISKNSELNLFHFQNIPLIVLFPWQCVAEYLPFGATMVPYKRIIYFCFSIN